MLFVLFDGDDVLGVFDTPNLDEKIKEYFGGFTSVNFKDVRDSGIEWVHEIRYDDFEGVEMQAILTLKDFELNEI